MTGSVCVFRAVDSAALASSARTDRVECGDVVDGRTAPQAQRKAMVLVDRVAGEGEDGTGETRAGKTPARAGASDWAGIATTAEGASHIGEEVGVEAALEGPAEDVIEIESNSEAWEVDSAGDKGDQERDALEMKSATEVEAVDPRGWIPREFRHSLEQLDQPEEQDKEEEQGAPSEVVLAQPRDADGAGPASPLLLRVRLVPPLCPGWAGIATIASSAPAGSGAPASDPTCGRCQGKHVAHTCGKGKERANINSTGKQVIITSRTRGCGVHVMSATRGLRSIADSEAEQKCSVCWDRFGSLGSPKEPVKLSCSHVFCRECMETWGRGLGKVPGLGMVKGMSCPRCRQTSKRRPHQLPVDDGLLPGAGDGGIHNPTDSQLGTEVDMLESPDDLQTNRAGWQEATSADLEAARTLSGLCDAFGEAKRRQGVFMTTCWQCKREHQSFKHCREKMKHTGTDWPNDPRPYAGEAQRPSHLKRTPLSSLERSAFMTMCLECKQTHQSKKHCRTIMKHKGIDWAHDPRRGRLPGGKDTVSEQTHEADCVGPDARGKCGTVSEQTPEANVGVGVATGRLLMDPKSAKRLRNQARSSKLNAKTNGKKRLSFDHARGRVPGLKSDHGAARNGGCSGAGLASGRSTQPLIGKCWECKAGRFKRNKHCVKTCRGARGSILYARSNAVRGLGHTDCNYWEDPRWLGQKRAPWQLGRPFQCNAPREYVREMLPPRGQPGAGKGDANDSQQDQKSGQFVSPDRQRGDENVVSAAACLPALRFTTMCWQCKQEHQSTKHCRQKMKHTGLDWSDYVRSLDPESPDDSTRDSNANANGRFVKGQKGTDVCEVCGNGGELICCDFCTHVYHVQTCLNARLKDLRQPWKCPRCSGTLAEVKADFARRSGKGPQSRHRGVSWDSKRHMWRARHQQKPGDSGRQTVGYFACEEEAAEAITIADAGLRPEDTEVLLNEDEDAGGDGETGLSMGRLLVDPKSAKRLRNQARSAKLESQTNGKKRLRLDNRAVSLQWANSITPIAGQGKGRRKETKGLDVSRIPKLVGPRGGKPRVRHPGNGAYAGLGRGWRKGIISDTVTSKWKHERERRRVAEVSEESQVLPPAQQTAASQVQSSSAPVAKGSRRGVDVKGSQARRFPAQLVERSPAEAAVEIGVHIGAVDTQTFMSDNKLGKGSLLEEEDRMSELQGKCWECQFGLLARSKPTVKRCRSSVDRSLSDSQYGYGHTACNYWDDVRFTGDRIVAMSKFAKAVSVHKKRKCETQLLG